MRTNGQGLATIDLTVAASDLAAALPRRGAAPTSVPLPASGRDRRAYERATRQQLDWLRSIRLKFGPAVSVVDLSSGGVLVETTSPLRPGSSTDLTIHGAGRVATTTLRVLRCEVARVNQGMVYRGACAFERAITLPSGSEPRGPRIGATSATAFGRPMTAGQAAELARVIDTIRAKALQMANGGVRATWAALLDDVHAAIRRGDPPHVILAAIDERVARLVMRPASPSSTLTDLSALERYEFPAAAEPEPQQGTALPVDGWSRLVVKYLDGRLLKGFSQDFHPSRAHFHLARSIQSTPHPPVLVPISQLKAVFFVRDFAGDPTYTERKSFEETAQGRRIEVTFLDDEVLVGSTLSYRPEGSGFFLTPADNRGNNLRVFIGPSAVRHIRYL